MYKASIGATLLALLAAGCAQQQGRDPEHARATGQPGRLQCRLDELQCRRRRGVRLRIVTNVELLVHAHGRDGRTLRRNNLALRRRYRLHRESTIVWAVFAPGSLAPGGARRRICRTDRTGYGGRWRGAQTCC